MLTMDRRIGVMNVGVVAEPGETVSLDVSPLAGDVRQMTAAQFRRLGVSSVVYLRVGTMDGEVVYAIHAADGIPMAVVSDVDSAVALVCQHGMAFAAVH
jgi:hypothetical protein